MWNQRLSDSFHAKSHRFTFYLLFLDSILLNCNKHTVDANAKRIPIYSSITSSDKSEDTKDLYVRVH